MILGLGLAVGFAIGHAVMFYFTVKPMVNTIIEMRKELGFVSYGKPERPESSPYPFVRED